jgi:superfamily II DNA/RNA helicase
MPPKTELTVYCQLAKAQLRTYKAVLKNHVEVLNSGPGGEKTKLLNIVMQLRKAANHPYLFDGASFSVFFVPRFTPDCATALPACWSTNVWRDVRVGCDSGVEDKSLDPFGEHLVEHSGKLRLLDKLIPRLQSLGSRILIFSQMTRMLDILDDYCAMRSLSFCRIDGQTSCEDRDRQIEEFNAPNSTHSVFLLSTRAGGLGINLTSADIVVLYDSDWNPQMDLQAQDRAHRIGQKKPVKVFRLITEHTIEERILARALQKLKLDALVIRSGGLVEKEKGTSKDDLLAAIRCGADAIFRAKDSDELVDEDIDAILARAEKQTKEMEAEMASLAAAGPSANALDSRAWKFDGDSDDEGQAEQFIDIGKRDRKAAAPTNIAAPVVFKTTPMLAPNDIDSVMSRPAQSFPPYKDLVLLALADPSIGDDAATAQKLIAAVKRQYPTMDFKKKNWATALAKAIDVRTVKETKNGPKWGGNKYTLSKDGNVELEKANETEIRRQSREEVDESKPAVDSEDTPWAGWKMRTYFMADGGEIKHYLPPRLVPSVAPEPSETKAAAEDESPDDDDDEEAEAVDEVERVLDKRVSEQGNTEYKVRWKGYTAEDDTWCAYTLVCEANH